MQEGYFKLAWSDIKNSPGWFAKVCLLGLISLIPVFGTIVLYGYAYGWARDIAWDVHRPMPEKIFGNEDGQLYSRGFHAWLILLIVSVVLGTLSGVFGDHEIVSLIMMVLALFLSVMANVCIMRAAIYGRLGAGFQLGRVWNMMRHDANGLLRILGMVVLVGAIIGVIWSIVFIIVLFATIMGAMGIAGTSIDWGGLADALILEIPGAEYELFDALAVLAPIIGIALLLFTILAYILAAAQAWITLLQTRALGYWTRQFDVPHWGGQDDPMPFEAQEAQAKAAAQFVAAQQYQQYQQYQQAQAQAQAQQNPYAQPVQGQAQAAVQPEVQNPYAAPQGYTQPVEVQNPYAAPVAAAGAATAAAAAAPAAPVQTAPIQTAPAAPAAPAQPAPATQFAPAAPAAGFAAETPALTDVPVPSAEAAPDASAGMGAPAYAGRPVAATEPVQVAYAPRWEKIDLDAPNAEQADVLDDADSVRELLESAGEQALQAAAEAKPDVSLPAYLGRPVEASDQAEVPMAPRWEKIDLDALGGGSGKGSAE